MSGCTTPRIVRKSNMVMSPAGVGTKDYCAGEGQQQFTGQTDRDPLEECLYAALFYVALRCVRISIILTDNLFRSMDVDKK
jgi:hypothetical protein